MLTDACMIGACHRCGAPFHVVRRWMALEAMTDMKFTLRSDIWSYAVTLWEFFTYGGTFTQKPGQRVKFETGGVGI